MVFIFLYKLILIFENETNKFKILYYYLNCLIQFLLF
jgi:hypothetical protein